ncbi:hypothetical protein [Methanolobus sp.]|uniref:hypothetical protein n=1 Tax=Methanolobus sp. TaxID=1874737 RepID=UPI0025D57452|nr:hypothetical protein [Methanolobus sp.]
MVLIESTELLENLSLLLKISREFKMHETSQAYADIIRHIKFMENEILLKKGRLNHYSSCKKSKYMAD